MIPFRLRWNIPSRIKILLCFLLWMICINGARHIWRRGKSELYYNSDFWQGRFLFLTHFLRTVIFCSMFGCTKIPTTFTLCIQISTLILFLSITRIPSFCIHPNSRDNGTAVYSEMFCKCCLREKEWWQNLPYPLAVCWKINNDPNL